MNNNLENNLYYTPTIEEFHIGFEYEEYQFLERNWKTVKCEFIKPNTTIDSKWFRVKYLDQSDIESLGWEFEKEHVGLEQLSFSINGPIYEDILYMDFDSKYMRIAWLGEGDITRFSGTIKNKSELIKLMQQLNIK